MQNDVIRLACEQAEKDFGSDEMVFNAAGFAQAMARIAGMDGLLDGGYVRAMLTGRDDVTPLGGWHYRLRVESTKG